MEDDGADVSDLVAAALGGDEGAWSNLIARYATLVYAVVLRHRLFGADADDVSQIVWLRLIEHLRDLREPRALPMWLVVTTRNECLRLINDKRRMQPRDPLTDCPETMAELPEPDEAIMRQERREVLLAAIAALPERQRDLLLLLIRNPEMSYAEAGRRLDMPVGSIGPTRARALERLRAAPSVAALFAAAPTTGGIGGGDRDIAAVGRGRG
jgi:RNA polymerase sigma factor (sigma-70 family)